MSKNPPSGSRFTRSVTPPPPSSSPRLYQIFVSRQLGHAGPAITLEIYAHLLEQADHAVAAREGLEARYAAMTSATQR